MKNKQRLIVITFLLLAAVGNYVRMPDSDSVRTVTFISIFAIGALSGLLIREITTSNKNTKNAE